MLSSAMFSVVCILYVMMKVTRIWGVAWFKLPASQLPKKSAVFLRVSIMPVIIMGLSTYHSTLFCKSLTIAFH